MSRKWSSSIILLLIITNIVTLIFWMSNGEEKKPHVNNQNEQEEIVEEDALATVDESEITYDDWIDELKEKQGKKQLKNMIDREIVQQLAAEEDIEINEKLIDRELALLMTMEGVMTEKEIKQEEEKLRRDIEHRFLLEALLAEDESIPEEEVRAFYDDYHKQYNFSESIQFSHIIVDDMDTAEKAISELDEGASFQLLAEEYSTDEDTKDQGGYLGFYSKTSQFVPPGYNDIASEMEAHSYSEPFRVNDGVAILYLHRSLPSYEFTYDEIKEHIKNELALKKLEKSLTADSLWEQFDIDWVYEE